MCGIFGGYSSSLAKADLELIHTLGILSQFRGVDSTGVIVGHNIKGKKVKKIMIRKDVGNSSNFLASDAYSKVAIPNEAFMVVGHTRWATNGTINVNNAHPFNVKNIYGVHNGTIPKHSVPHDRKDYDSDSQVFFRDLQENGIDKAVENAGYSPALAVVYVDTEASTLNFFRNDKRPLFAMPTKANDTIFWASEYSFLEFAERRSPIICDDIIEIEKDKLHTIKIGSLDVTTRELVKTPPPPFVLSPWTGMNGSPKSDNASLKKEHKRNKKYYYNQAADADANTSLRGVDLSASGKKKPSTIVSVDSKYKGYMGKEFNVSTILNYLQKGCIFSGYIPNIFERVIWINDKQFYTPAFHSPEVREYLIGTHNPVFEGKIEGNTVQ